MNRLRIYAILMAGFFVAVPLFGMDEQIPSKKRKAAEQELLHQYIGESLPYAIANEQDELDNTFLHREILQIPQEGTDTSYRLKIFRLVKNGVNPYIQNIEGHDALSLCNQMSRSWLMDIGLWYTIVKARGWHYYTQLLNGTLLNKKRKFFPHEIAATIADYAMRHYDRHHFGHPHPYRKVRQ